MPRAPSPFGNVAEPSLGARPICPRWISMVGRPNLSVGYVVIGRSCPRVRVADSATVRYRDRLTRGDVTRVAGTGYGKNAGGREWGETKPLRAVRSQCKIIYTAIGFLRDSSLLHASR